MQTLRQIKLNEKGLELFDLQVTNTFISDMKVVIDEDELTSCISLYREEKRDIGDWDNMYQVKVLHVETGFSEFLYIDEIELN